MLSVDDDDDDNDGCLAGIVCLNVLSSRSTNLKIHEKSR